MRAIESLLSRTGIIGELVLFFYHHKWWWLLPMVVALLLFAILMLFAQSSAIAPFVYTLF
jgi:hypothetical protein